MVDKGAFLATLPPGSARCRRLPRERICTLCCAPCRVWGRRRPGRVPADDGSCDERSCDELIPADHAGEGGEDGVTFGGTSCTGAVDQHGDSASNSLCADAPFAPPAANPKVAPGRLGLPRFDPLPIEPAGDPPAGSESAWQVERIARKASKRLDYHKCAVHYQEAATLYRTGGVSSAAARCFACAADAFLNHGLPFEALICCQFGLRMVDQDICSLICGTRALEALGLLHLCEITLRLILSDAGTSRAVYEQMQRSLTRVMKRAMDIAKGDHQVLEEQIDRMGSLLETVETGHWTTQVKELAACTWGRSELVHQGFITVQPNPNPAVVERIALYSVLRYRVRKRSLRRLSAAGMAGPCSLNGEVCTLPRTFAISPCSNMLDETACVKLASDRFLVVDGAIPLRTLSRVLAEISALATNGYMMADPEDICCYRAFGTAWPFFSRDGEPCQMLEKDCPATCEVTRQLAGIAHAIEDTLEERFGVPQTVHISFYPCGADYKKHLDSSNLYGGFDDNPFRLTMTIFLFDDSAQRASGQMRYWPSAGGRLGRAAPREVHFLNGRIVIFWSREIWYELAVSGQSRYMLTLWLHDR